MANQVSTVLCALLAGVFLLPGCGDDVTLIRIHDLQGTGHASEFVDIPMTTTRGVVTAIQSSTSFFVQSRPGEEDNDPNTSEGIFVASAVAIEGDKGLGVVEGDYVELIGVVEEVAPASFSQLPLRTEFVRARVVIIDRQVELPAPVRIGPSDIPAVYSTTSGEITSASLDRTSSALDFYESLEGMLVEVENPLVVAPPRFGKIPTIPAGGGGDLLSDRGALVVSAENFHPERLLLDDAFASSEPDVSVGYQFGSTVEGIMTNDAFDYVVMVREWPAGTDPELAQEVTTLEGDATHLTIASYNVQNLTATASADTFAAHATIIVEHMKNPDIVALQEMGDNDGTTEDDPTNGEQTFQNLIDAISAESNGVDYELIQVNPGPPADGEAADGGLPSATIRVGYLYNPARVTFNPVDSPDATTAAAVTNSGGVPTLSLNPGRIDPANEVFDGGRKSLAAVFEFNGERVYVINNHLKSKRGDDPLFAQVQPPVFSTEELRNSQAEVIAGFVDEITAVDGNANVVVLGDLNDFHFSPPVATLKGNNRLSNLIDKLPANDQYTFIFLGNAQILDNILATPNIADDAEVDIVHVNIEFPSSFDGRASDHDPVVSRFAIP